MSSGILTVAKKELSTYFSSPVAFIFLGTFLFVSMFVFFWLEQFFVRNIVDVRPLFEWMPALLVFLVAALTMKMWSEERRMGTLEFLLTMPVRTTDLVFGKFVACMGLVAIALVLTIGVPITVSFMGDLDWGPVFGAYLAALLLAAAYVSIGLFVSSKTDNQIVSLIVTIVLCYVFYIIGSEALASLVGNRWSELFALFSTGARFQSITRGVIDVRDLYYYLSIVGVFLALNTYSLERLKWSEESQSATHGLWRGVTALLVANLVIANVWIHAARPARADLTQGNMYSISPATEALVSQLQEPLLIRGYFSAKTHPLLAPLVPQIRDLIREYEAVSDGRVQAEFVDPRGDQDLEQEANQKYNIKPVPFQISDKYQASLVNSYFNVLVQYGDKFEVLGFDDLIEIKQTATRDIDVQLRNLEYDITRSIKKVLYGFQNVDSLFASLREPAKFVGYFSPKDTLPEALQTFSDELNTVLADLKKESSGKFEYEIIDPQANDGAVATEINEKYGFRPMVASLLDPRQFYFYMLLEGTGSEPEPVPLPENLGTDGARQTIEAALQRISPGFLKTVGLYTPPASMPREPWAQQMGMGDNKQFQLLQQKLSEGYTVKPVNLTDGTVAQDIDLLLLASPKDLDKKSLFAVDQFLMKGGTVVLASSPYSVTQSRMGVNATLKASGLEEWLEKYGIKYDKNLVLDPQNENFPVPVRRNLGGFSVEEIRMIPYPYFVDVRSDGMNQDNVITSGIPQVTLNWPSPLLIDAEKSEKEGRTITTLLESSEKSWGSDSTQLQPNFTAYPELGFGTDGARQRFTLAAIVEGSFESFFKGKDSPLLDETKATEEADDAKGADTAKKDKEEEKKEVITSVIEKSPESGRIILIASNEFLTDQTLQISRAIGSTRFLNSLQLVENTIDWSLEDRGLLSIRSRGHFTRTLYPMEADTRVFFEYLNYGLIVLGLFVVFVIDRSIRVRARQNYQQLLAAA